MEKNIATENDCVNDELGNRNGTCERTSEISSDDKIEREKERER